MTKPIVKIEDGRIQGKKSKNFLGDPFFSFLGIPYAESPVGSFRFRAPVPRRPWAGVRKAVRPGPACPSPHTYFQYLIGTEEDCLNLNVFTKTLPGPVESLKPVMVFIHGGAFKMGSNDPSIYGPDFLMMEDIVLVAINYRLGVLGFLSLEDSSLGVPGNAGMKDMVLALRWVQKNIREFNGNKNNVTIFGESAGAAACHYLYLSPVTKGLFHKVICQSGCTLNGWAAGCTNGRTIAECLGYKETSERKILEKLRKEPPKALIRAQRKIFGFTPDFVAPFGPVVEKPSNEPAFLSEAPIDILRNGTFNKVPIIMGYNSEEAIMYQLALTLMRVVRDHRDFEKEIPYDLKLEYGSSRSTEVAKKIKKFYFDDEEMSQRNRLKLFPMKTDTAYIIGIHRSIKYMKTGGAPVYLYRMSLETSLNFGKNLFTARCFCCFGLCFFYSFTCCCGSSRSLCRLLMKMMPHVKLRGVCHGDDLSYLFRARYHPKPRRNSIEEVSIRRFVKLWTNFARTGNPTPSTDDLIDVVWPPVAQKDYFLDIGGELVVGSDPLHIPNPFNINRRERVRKWVKYIRTVHL